MPRRPEILAPAGDRDCLMAAIENGADAVYFGLQGGFNARARAANFDLETLPEVMALLHRRGVKGYVAFNTLVFEDELEGAERRLRAIVAAGADAVIVQDLGVARLLREISADIPIHASTQMTVTSAEGAELARRMGASRVIVARELSVADIRDIMSRTEIELEVFVHGALCVSYSGQCLTSEHWGGRSANRGECAQACRLPYDLVVDGVVKDLGAVRYLLSPKDLAAWELLPELIDLGVAGLKIEGRLKQPEYVANTTATYRRVIDQVMGGARPTLSIEEQRDLEQSFSRGLAHGFLDGVDHQKLVEGRSPKKRGVLLGRVERLDPAARIAVIAPLEGEHEVPPVKRGDGLVFEGPDPEAGEQGGAIYDVVELDRGRVELGFGRERGPDLSSVDLGARVFKTLDPALDKRLRATFEGGAPRRKAPISLSVRGRSGAPLEVIARDDLGHNVTARSTMPLEAARKRPLGEEILREQLGRLGTTIFELGAIELDLPEPVIVPVSELNRLRRVIAEELEAARAAPPPWKLSEPGALSRLREAVGASGGPRAATAPSPELSILVRSEEQVEAAIEEGVERIYLDFLELVGLSRAVERVRAAGRTPVIATPRIGKPGEEQILRKLLALRPAGLLARHIGAVETVIAARQRGEAEVERLALIGDFSLNAANALTAAALLERGLDLLTPSHDLDADQLLSMCALSAPDRFEVVVHQHLPMFHNEHCVFAALLSSGKDWRDCGRPCDHHRVELRDRIGRSHAVLADVGCRNTVFNDRPQSAAELLPRFMGAGMRRFRVELLHEDRRAARAIISRYHEALTGKLTPKQLFKDLDVASCFGVVGMSAGGLPVIR